MHYLITGGAGFIGSAVCRRLVENPENNVTNVDKLTYAGNLASLSLIEARANYQFVKSDICDGEAMFELLRDNSIDIIIHLAAESHVDRSIDGPKAFIDTNIMGTYGLLEAARNYYETLVAEKRDRFCFHHVSTDEVFGDLHFDQGAFCEETPYAPSSPYSASKAASDHLVRAWHHTYGLPVVVSNCSNNYGPFQLPEKLIPLTILNALEEKPLPIYGNGRNVRDWLYVDDHVNALVLVATQGIRGESYAIGARSERTNIEVVTTLCTILDEKKPRKGGCSYGDLVEMVKDRPGHDQRYAVDPSKIERNLGWRAKTTFESGLRNTIEWYLDNEPWWAPIRCHQEYRRLGSLRPSS